MTYSDCKHICHVNERGCLFKDYASCNLYLYFLLNYCVSEWIPFPSKHLHPGSYPHTLVLKQEWHHWAIAGPQIVTPYKSCGVWNNTNVLGKWEKNVDWINLKDNLVYEAIWQQWVGPAMNESELHTPIMCIDCIHNSKRMWVDNERWSLNCNLDLQSGSRLYYWLQECYQFMKMICGLVRRENCIFPH